MTQVARFLDELKLAINDLLSGKKTYHIFSNFDLNNISTSLENDIKKYIKNKASYKSNAWIKINYVTSTLTLDQIDQDFNLNINEIPKYIDELLNEEDKYNNFEILCSILFESLLGSLTVEHRMQSRDGGIDFYGSFQSKSCLIEKDDMTDFLDINSWYIGQAKYYKSSNGIGTAYLRELIGTVELARRNIWATKKGHNHFAGIEHFHNIIPIFLTNSYYSRDSYKVSEQFNIKLFDYTDIIFWLSVLFKCNKNNFEQKFILEKTR